MFNWRGKYREHLAKNRLREKERLDKQRAHLKECIEAIKDRMTEAPCPIRGGNCFDGCVHFQEGETYIMPSFGHGDSFWSASYPKCKLWG